MSVLKKKVPVVIFGAEGHAKVVADILRKGSLYEVVAFVDVNEHDEKIWDINIVSEETFLRNPHVLKGVIAIGDNYRREKVVAKVKGQLKDFDFISAVHPSAQLGEDVFIGAGSVIMAGATVNPSSQIGEHCIINTNSSVDHDCLIRAFASIAPSATIGGNCEIGTGSAISIGATLIHGIQVGSHSVIGAGTVLTKPIPGHSVAYGVPGRVIRSRKKEDRYL